MLLQGFQIFLKKLFTKKKCRKKLYHKTVTLHCHCEANVKYRFLSKTLLMKAAICRFRKCQSNDKLLRKIISSSYYIQ